MPFSFKPDEQTVVAGSADGFKASRGGGISSGSNVGKSVAFDYDKNVMSGDAKAANGMSAQQYFLYLLDQDGAQYLWLDPFGHTAGMVFDTRINKFLVGSKGGTMSSNQMGPSGETKVKLDKFNNFDEFLESDKVSEYDLALVIPIPSNINIEEFIDDFLNEIRTYYMAVGGNCDNATLNPLVKAGIISKLSSGLYPIDSFKELQYYYGFKVLNLNIMRTELRYRPRLDIMKD